MSLIILSGYQHTNQRIRISYGPMMLHSVFGKLQLWRLSFPPISSPKDPPLWPQFTTNYSMMCRRVTKSVRNHVPPPPVNPLTLMTSAGPHANCALPENFVPWRIRCHVRPHIQTNKCFRIRWVGTENESNCLRCSCPC